MIGNFSDTGKSGREITDFSDCMHYNPEEKAYSMQLRWKPLSTSELFGLSVHLSSRALNINSVDLNQSKIGFLIFNTTKYTYYFSTY